MIDYNKEAEEWLKDYDLENSSFDFEEGFADFAKYCVKQAIPVILQKAANNAQFEDLNGKLLIGASGNGDYYFTINKQSILNLKKELEKELL